MQTSQIKIDGIYAYQPQNREMVRFKVTEIVTRKTSNSQGAQATVVGFIVEDTKEGNTPHKINLPPASLMGPYEKHLDLVQKQKEEKEAREKQTRERTELALADRLRLYKFVDVEPPANAEDYNQLFPVRYSWLNVTEEGTEAIVAVIRRMAL